MCVRPTDPERRHTRTPRTPTVRPLPRLGEQLHLTRGPVDPRRPLPRVQRLRQHLRPDRLDRLDQPGDPRGRPGVPDVRLDGAEPQRPVGGPALSVGRHEGLGLDRVAERRPGAVCLDGVDVGGRQPRVGEGHADHPLLGGSVGSGESVAGAVLVDGGAADDGEHPVPVAFGVGELLDEEQPHAVREPHAVGAVGERLAAAVGGESVLGAEAEELTGRGEDGDAADEGERALVAAQGLDGEVEGDEGGGAGGVQGDGGAFEAVQVGEPAGDDGGGGAGGEVSGVFVGDAAGGPAVLQVVGADEDAGAAAAEGGRDDSGVFEGFPGGFEEQPLLGVHGGGFARGDAEEVRVEAGDVGEEPAVPGVGGAGVVGVGVVEAVEVPAPVVGEGADGVLAPADEVPQVLGRGDVAGVAAGHADDGDGLGGLELLDAPAGVVEFGRGPLQVFAKRLFTGHGSPPVLGSWCSWCGDGVRRLGSGAAGGSRR
ncbi:hypothetical protein SFUMM280S_10879 [Streptomyces fumanus]